MYEHALVDGSARPLSHDPPAPVPDSGKCIRMKRSACLKSQSFGLISLDFMSHGFDHPCPYLPGRFAREEVFRADALPPELYHDFMDHGFRRSGVLIYRPVCDGCAECYQLRVPAQGFVPSKSQRRVMRKGSDVTVKAGKPRITKEKWKIYSDYLAFQHTSGDNDSFQDLERFLYNSPVHTYELEYRVGDKLAAVSIVDICSRSMSSVYVYYDPDFSPRSLGTYSALREIDLCRRKGIPFYYLGFYVPGCPAMNYKARFAPSEILVEECKWEPLSPAGPGWST